jgi:hypothetical protein
MIYVNGDSYLHNANDGRNVASFLGEYTNDHVVDSSIPGSCNNRILRTSLRDLLVLKQTHENITAFIGLTYIFRSDVWDTINQPERWKNSNDGEFASYPLMNFNEPLVIPNYLKPYAQQWAKWYHYEAEITKLLQGVILLSTWCKTNNITLRIFSSTSFDQLIDIEAPFIRPFYIEISKDANVIDLFNFSLIGYCKSLGHVPYDSGDHLAEPAHKDAAAFLLTTL